MHRVALSLRHIVSLGILTLLMTSYFLLPVPSAVQADAPRTGTIAIQVPMVHLGESPFDGRIVGGTVATPHEYPWQVLLQITIAPYVYLCGGSVITPQYILTAAHCVTDNGVAVPAAKIKVYAGVHDRRQLGNTRVQSRTGAQLVVHGAYDAYSYDYDIAVVKLDRALTINTYVKTIRLAKNSETNLFAAGNDVIVSGWGTTSSGGSSSQYLRKTTIDIVSRATCNRENSYAGSITYRMLCAARAGKDSCQGDSGGPLFLRSGDMYKQVGIVSWGEGCADPAYPGVYTHLGVLRNWVATKVPSLP